MNKKEREYRANKVCQLLEEAAELLNGIVWESQEGQPDYIDKLTRLERIQIISTRALAEDCLIHARGWRDTLSSLNSTEP